MNSNRINKIEKIITENKLPKYTGSQIYDALFKKGTKSFSEITSLSKEIRNILEKEIGPVLSLKKIAESSVPQVHKYLFETEDGEKIESVIMEYKKRTALCVSTQVGCAMGCQFCATGKMGLKRNLTSDEIVDQWLYFKQQGISVDSVVFMGMGEPLVNPDFFDALEMMIDPKYFGLSSRSLSVSTIGIIPGIQKMRDKFPQINLAFSLHAPFEDERSSLMPINKTYSTAEVFKALNRHLQKNKRKIFIVYLLLHGVNDSKEHAEALSKLIKSQGEFAYLYHVNLMKFHPASTLMDFEETPDNILKHFEIVLLRNGINYTVRKDFGLGIDAACGQLRSRKI